MTGGSNKGNGIVKVIRKGVRMDKKEYQLLWWELHHRKWDWAENWTRALGLAQLFCSKTKRKKKWEKLLHWNSNGREQEPSKPPTIDFSCSESCEPAMQRTLTTDKFIEQFLPVDLFSWVFSLDFWWMASQWSPYSARIANVKKEKRNKSKGP